MGATKASRRRFLSTASGAVATVAATIADAPHVIAQPKVQWRMSTAFTTWLDMHHRVAAGLAKSVDEMSGGRFRIEVYYPGWHEPGTVNDFGFNKKAYEALPIDLRRMLDHAAAAVHIYSLTDFHTKNAIALERLRTEFKGKVEILQFPAPVLRDLKKLATEVVKEESEKTPMARKVHASYTKFQALVGPWDRVAEGAYHQLVAT
jgi:TRAP-type mannitol/chloroaromatic compound transport system substrate-binding protein